DERGIVMGEFGFITADGIYHVTVYATDEEGKFRIISMKSYPYSGPLQEQAQPTTTTTPAPTTRGPSVPPLIYTAEALLAAPPESPATRPLVTPLRITAQSPFPPLAPSPQLLDIGASLNVQLPFQQSIAQTVHAALASESQQLSSIATHTQTPAQTQTQAQRVSSSSFSSSSSGNQAQLPPRNTLITPSSQQQRDPLAAPVPPASYDLAKLERIPAAAAGAKELQSHAFGTPIKGAASSLVETANPYAELFENLERIPLNTPSKQQRDPAPASFDLSKLERIPAAAAGAKELQNYAFGTPTKGAGTTNPYSQLHENLQRIPLNTLVTPNEQQRDPLPAPPSRTPFAAVGNAGAAGVQQRPQPAAGSSPIAGTGKTTTSAAKSPSLATTATQAGKPALASSATLGATAAGQRGAAAGVGAGAAGAGLGAAGIGAAGAGLGSAGKGAAGAGAGSAGKGAAGAGIGSAGTGAAGAGIGSAGAGAGVGKVGAAQAAGAGAGHSGADDTGDLYRFKYLLDYNGHEETGSRNGNKQGNYFAIGDDAVARTIEYIANEFGFQPHISWRKLDDSELRALPKENALQHYEFKWFNQD
ncbi:hypothetical protein KR222_007379, partial [Zaprionus bogoriensis]